MQQNTSISPYKLKNEGVLFLFRCKRLSLPHEGSKSRTPCLGLFNRHVQISPCALTKCADAKNIMLTSKPHLQRSRHLTQKGVRIPTTLLGNHLNLVSHCFDGLAHDCTNTNTVSHMYMP